MPSDEDAGQSRKRLIVGILSVFLLVAMVIGLIAFILSERAAEEAADLQKRTMSKTMRAVDLFCAPTDYRRTCQDTLEGVLSRSPDAVEHPHAAAAAALEAVTRELASGFQRCTLLDAVRQSNESLVWEAVHDCRMLLEDCRANIQRSLESISWRGVDGPAEDLKAWLSAVITFQGSCVDMFPKGEVREQVKAHMQKAREISSNAIAIIEQGAALSAMIDLDTDFRHKEEQGNNSTHKDRRLFQQEEESEVVPAWALEDDRRELLEDDESAEGEGSGKPQQVGLTPNVTVAKDGSGDFKNITAALDAMPESYTGRYVIYVKEGVYDETVNISNKRANVTMYGDGSKKSIVTGSKSIMDGIRMWRTATFSVDGDSFTAMRLGIRNTAGVDRQQALALRVKGDKAIFFNCRIEGNQDTLFAQAYRQFYRSCVISGTVDFIFGDAAAVFQRCVIQVLPPRPGQPAVVTAHARRDHQQTTGFVVHKSSIVADDRLAAAATTKTYLGRPWKEWARVVVMESVVEGFVHDQGYMPWEGQADLGTAFFGEFGNTGDGADFADRKDTKGVHVMSRDKALQFTVGRFLHGAEWIPARGMPVTLELSS